jgi:hypothetical protein
LENATQITAASPIVTDSDSFVTEQNRCSTRITTTTRCERDKVDRMVNVSFDQKYDGGTDDDDNPNKNQQTNDNVCDFEVLAEDKEDGWK